MLTIFLKKKRLYSFKLDYEDADFRHIILQTIYIYEKHF